MAAVVPGTVFESVLLKGFTMPQISVIVPVYKVEQYLDDCIQSILNQTFSDFELILVDDGSPDNCGAMCDRYAEKDSRVKVIHQENQGLSGARNSGLDAARGEYVTFVDSDDVIHPCFLEILQRSMEKQTDLAVCRFREFTDGENPDVSIFRASPSGQPFDARSAVIRLYEGSLSVPVNAWGKLFRRSLIGNLRFPLGRLHEDQAFTPYVCYRARRIMSVDAPLYYYRMRPASITKTRFSAKRYDDLWAIDSCIRFFEEKEEMEILKAARAKRQRLLSVYTIYAWRDKVEVPQEYRVNLWRAIRYLEKNVDEDRFQYYLAQIHPKLPLLRAYERKIVQILSGK